MNQAVDMRHARVVFILVTLLVTSSLPLAASSEGRSTVCGNIDISTMSDPIIIADQDCKKISLGILAPGTIVDFDVSSDVNFDFLVFRNAALQAYSNDQSYRSTVYWAEETVFEDMNGSARWHWTVPLDEDEKNWYVVLDNLDHLGDDDQGAQGGSTLQISLDISFPTQSYWAMHDALVNLDTNSHTKLIDENLLILDEGTQVSISAIPLSGNPDLFILTENQRTSYLEGNPPEFRVTGADLLQVTSEDSVVWTVDSTHANQPLYLYADNEVGPNGGGDGSGEARFTVIVTILPILNPTITSDAAATVDVGELVTLSANNTPNLSNQIDTNAFEWDLDGDGSFEETGSWVQVSHEANGTYDVSLRVNGVDGRTASSSTSFEVEDLTPPTPIINGGDNLIRGFDESFTLTSSSQDNWGIWKEEWVVDGVIEQIDFDTGNTFTYSFSTAGVQTVTLRVFDEGTLSASQTINVTIQDRTAPILEFITGPTEVMAGEENTWRLNASDSESSTLTWSWDFDRSVDIDEDGDTKNDAESTGDLTTWIFTKGGDYAITATVTNEQGISSTRELNVYVEELPVEKSSTLTYIYGGGAILLAIATIAGGIFLFRSINQRRAHQELMSEEAARREAEEEAASREPDHDEQLKMFQNRGGASSGFQRGGGNDMAEIAGVGAGYGAQQSMAPTQRQSGVDDDALLSAFAEPDVEPTPTSQPEPKPEPQSTEPTKRASVLSSGIEMPTALGGSPTTKPVETAPTPLPVAVEPTPAPVEETTEVIGTCGDCGQHYAVDMPSGIEQAQIDCPKCGKRSTIRR